MPDCGEMTALSEEHAERHLPGIAQLRTGHETIEFLTGIVYFLAENGAYGHHGGAEKKSRKRHPTEVPFSALALRFQVKQICFAQRKSCCETRSF